MLDDLAGGSLRVPELQQPDQVGVQDVQQLRRARTENQCVVVA